MEPTKSFGAGGGKFGRNSKQKRPKRAKRVEAPKACRFTKEKLFEVDYRDIGTLQRLVSAQGKISGRKRNGTSAFYQRQVSLAVKRARFLALLPFLGE
jgi:small subunit ribosomal protein S18